MSIFKVRNVWSNERLQSEEYIEGIQSSCCIKVDKFNSHNDSDCIIVGEERQLKIYKPNNNEGESNVILESRLDDFVLQIETGKFMTDSQDRQILVLHPQKYAVYTLEIIDGNIQGGEQNQLKPLLKHTFTRKAYCVTIGSFGNIKSRDLLCIQALDGSLSFFDQDTFLFLCIFNDIIIPGPICYVASSDLFVIHKSSWVLEIYSYQQLVEFSELSTRQNKKCIPQWTYYPGEEISTVQVIRTSNNFSSIIALGEKYLYCFQDNGLMKYMIRLDFMPVCFHAYLIGWYYEPNSRLLVMVASEDSKLYIFEETSLLWSCDLLHKIIAISRCFLKNIPAGLVTLSTNGIIHVSCLGTVPDLNSNVVSMNNEVESQNILEDLQLAEEKLQRVMGNEDNLEEFSLKQNISLKVDVGNPMEHLNSGISEANNFKLIYQCPLITVLNFEDPKQLQNIQITYNCIHPFVILDPTICLENVNGTEIIETHVYLKNNFDVSNTQVKIFCTITDCLGKVFVLEETINLPLKLYAYPVEETLNNSCNIEFSTSYQMLTFDRIFQDFNTDQLSVGSNGSVSFLYRASHKVVTLKITTDLYTIEANDFTQIGPFLDFILHQLQKYGGKNGECTISLKINSETIKQIVHKFLKCIETHAKERIKLKNIEEELNILQSQFMLVQKQLLVQYGSLPPGDCDPLEYLMRGTYNMIVNSSHRILETKKNICRASCELSSMGNLILLILKQTNKNDMRLKILEETLCFESFQNDVQEWEESVAQASKYIINNILKKSEKDKEKLSLLSDQDILSQANLKKFIKQTRVVVESLFFNTLKDEVTEKKEVLTRVEEFVELI